MNRGTGTAVLVMMMGFAGTTMSEEKAKAKVEGTFVIPGTLESFQGRVVEIRLYAYDPRIADKGADLVEKIDMKEFKHEKGKETKREFTIGAKADLAPTLGYYLTFFVLDGNNRTHIGEAEHSKKDLCKVLTNGGPNKVAVTFRPVR